MNIMAGGRAACFVGLALSATTVSAEPLAAQAEATADYDLPAQDLGQTLRAIAQISGQEILFPSQAVQGRTAPAVKGRLNLGQALRAALAGTPLVVEHRAGAVLIREPSAAPGESARADVHANPITVTGTRIRGAGSASPVIVTTRQSLEQQGVTDLAGFTRVLPQNYTGGQNPGVAGGGQQGGQENVNNSATLNLRGLGPDATLTLLNGHRLAYDGLNQGIDISAIPLSAIDRIEVIADGASALYGSDAVAGVANIILRRDYDGLETSARIGGSTSGGNFQQQASLVGGQRWSSGGTMVALDYSHATPIFAEQRDYTRNLPSLTLTERNRQWSGVVTGHQQLTGGVSLEFDGYFMQRRSLKQSPFLPPESVFSNGLVNRPDVRSYAITPTLRIDLPGRWETSLSATRAVSRTRLTTTRFFDGSGFRSYLTYRNGLSGIEGTAEGPLISLPGGAARLAVGGGLRKVSLHDNITDIISGQPVTFRDFTESRQVQFAYGELSVPLVGPDQRLPLIERLRLSGAVRYERWKGIDSVATPKLGIVYQPVSDITISGTWGRSFKAPTLNQVHQPLQGFLLPGFVFAPQPEPPLEPGGTVLLLGGGNPDLHSERATTWSATMDLRPRFLDGLKLEASYFDVDYRGRIVSPVTGLLSSLSNPIFQDLVVLDPTIEQVNALVASFPEGLVIETGEPFDPASVGAIIDDSLRNSARQHIRGVDLSGEYRVELGRGQRLLLSGAASYLESDQQLSPDQPTVQMAGIIFNPPHWRGRLGAVWDSPRAGLAAFLHYVGGTLDNRFPTPARISPFVTLDISASYRTSAREGPLSGIELRLSALNLLNEKPDSIRVATPESPPYDSTNQSPVGRFIGLAIRKVW